MNVSAINARQLFHYLKQFPIEERPIHAPDTPEMEILKEAKVLLPFCDDYLATLPGNNRSIETEIIDICCPYDGQILEKEIAPLFKERFGKTDIFRIVNCLGPYDPIYHLVQMSIPEKYKMVCISKGVLRCDWNAYPEDRDRCYFHRSCDALYDIQVKGDNIEQLQLEIGGTIIETLTKPTKGNVWRFQSFQHFMTPLILLALQFHQICFIKKGGNSAEFNVECYNIFYGMPIRKEAVMIDHTFNISDGATFSYKNRMGIKKLIHN